MYAREYAAARIGAPADPNDVTAIERLQDQAYFRCLNQDIEPPFPETSAYFGASMGEIAGDTSGGVGEGDITASDTPVGMTAATVVPTPVLRSAAAASAASAAATVAATAATGPDGWSKKRIAWCKEHYPNSFDEATGMVLTLEGDKKLCPH